MKNPPESPEPQVARNAPDPRSRPGAAGPGKTIDPLSAPTDRQPGEKRGEQPRPAPAPGVPVADKEYERLKERAKFARTAPGEHGQADPAESE